MSVHSNALHSDWFKTFPSNLKIFNANVKKEKESNYKYSLNLENNQEFL